MIEGDLSSYRKSYEKKELLESEIDENPIQQFQSWFYDALKNGGEEEANAMAVATKGLDGFPKIRTVLLKRFTHEGFIFYTNYNSEKGRAIAKDERICLHFYWPSMERQVIIKGKAEKLTPNLSDGYFESRPRGSQLAALASPQSEVIPSREYLDQKLDELNQLNKEKSINRPSNWGGYLVRPIELEFWQGRPNRLHDRIRFQLESPSQNWVMERLAP